MSELSVTLTLLLFPGVICALFVEQLVPTREWSSFRFPLYSFVLGLVCYLIYALITAGLHWRWPPDVSFVKVLATKDPAAVYDSLAEIFWVSLLAVPVAADVSFILNHKWLHRIAAAIKVTEKFGDLDVWAFVFNSNVTEWVTVRDIKNDLMYQGWVHAFSDSCTPNELLLRDVQVFRNSTGEELYKTDALYLSRPLGELTLEFTWTLQGGTTNVPPTPTPTGATPTTP
ncbi:MAG: DUF6338 family protein [Candidatus Binatia bacterium]